MGKSGRAISLVSAHDLMNFNRLVKRYHVEVRELAVPSDEEVQAAQGRADRDAPGRGGRPPLEDYAEPRPVARRIAEHEQRDRIVAALVRGRFAAAAGPPEEVDEPPAGPPPRRSGGPGGGRGGPPRGRRPHRR